MTRTVRARLLVVACATLALVPGAGRASDPVDGATSVSFRSTGALAEATADASADASTRVLRAEVGVRSVLPYATVSSGFAYGWGVARFARLWAPGALPAGIRPVVTLTIDPDSLPHAGASDVADAECTGLIRGPLGVRQGTRCASSQTTARVWAWAGTCEPDADLYFDCDVSGIDHVVTLARAGQNATPSVGAGSITVDLQGWPDWPGASEWLQIGVELVAFASVEGAGTPLDPSQASASGAVRVDVSVG